MKFTDDDLKRWREEISMHRDGCTCQEHGKLARLEAAEQCAERLGCIIDGGTLNRLETAWRKSKGE